MLPESIENIKRPEVQEKMAKLADSVDDTIEKLRALVRDDKQRQREGRLLAAEGRRPRTKNANK